MAAAYVCRIAECRLTNADERLRTFTFSPMEIKLRSRDYVRSGFYYTGDNFKIRCFSCNLMIDKLHPKDDLNTTHYLRSPNCMFISKIVNRPERSPSFYPFESTTDKPIDKSSIKQTVSTKKRSYLELLKKVEEFEQLLTCKICLNDSVKCLVLPCRHLAACMKCTSRIDHCCICRTRIKGTVKAIIS
jgi:hypothetical protein